MPSTALGSGMPAASRIVGPDVDAVGELGAHLLVGLEAGRPRHDHRVAGAAEVAGRLLAPLERGVAGVRPRGRDVRRRVVAAERLDAAVLVDQLELLLGVEHEAVEERHLVERAGGRALQAGAVVAPDVDDERVVEVAHLLDGVEQAADVPVGVLLEAAVDLHLAHVELLLLVGERVPGGEGVGALGELGVLRHDAELLLPRQRALAQRVPAVVELALVLVRPLLGDVVRGMGAAGGVEEHPRLVRVLGTDRVQPLDRLVGDVVGEVVELAVLALGDAQRPVVLGDDGVVLAGGAAEEAPPVVEAPGLGPVVERTGRALHVVRREVPLAEAAGDVAVLLEDAREGGAGARLAGRVAGEGPRELGDGAEADAVLVAAGEQRRARRRAHGRHVEAVVRDAHVLHAREGRRVYRAAEAVDGAEAGVVDEDERGRWARPPGPWARG